MIRYLYFNNFTAIIKQEFKTISLFKSTSTQLKFKKTRNTVYCSIL